MKLLNLIIFILIIFYKTGNLLSKEGIFYVNNIPVLKEKISLMNRYPIKR